MNFSKSNDSRQIAKWSAAGALSTAHDVGYSISFCVSAMARGEVDPKEVKLIVAGTAATTPESWERLIDSYKESYWYSSPEAAEAILRDFLRRGKVVQPRLVPSIGVGPQLGMPDKGLVKWGRMSDPVWFLASTRYTDTYIGIPPLVVKAMCQ